MKLSSFPAAQEIKHCFPIPLPEQEQIAENRRTIQRILSGEDPRRIVIVGPCSIHNTTAAKEFASRLSILSKQVSSEFFLVMRTYFEKARSGVSWKGFLYDPDLNGSYNIQRGVEQTRRFLLDLAEMGVPAGAELLNPLAAPYYTDLLSWGSIGARTSSSQAHREFASTLDFPVGIKNSTEGNIQSAVSGVAVASSPQTILSQDERGNTCLMETLGNPSAHVVLRGGETGTNYDSDSISQTLSLLREQNLPERVLIDCSHGNSRKQPTRQPVVFQDVLEQILDGNFAIRGMMLESHLHFGQQEQKKELSYGISITDPCLDWDRTEEVILHAYSLLAQEKLSLARL